MSNEQELYIQCQDAEVAAEGEEEVGGLEEDGRFVDLSEMLLRFEKSIV